MSLGSMELCGGVHTAQRQITTQIPIEFCILVIGLGLGFGHCQSDYTITIEMAGQGRSRFYSTYTQFIFTIIYKLQFGTFLFMCNTNININRIR